MAYAVDGKVGEELVEAISADMWRRALSVTISSFLFGYTFACLNPCFDIGNATDGKDCYNGTGNCPKGSIYTDLNLTTLEASAGTSATVLGAWIGCLIGNAPAMKYGRKTTLLANNGFYIVGAILASLGFVESLFIGRFITGLGIGVTSVVAPVLLSEIATPKSRGTICTMHQLLVTAAIFFSSLLGYGLVTYVKHGWQYMQAFGAVPAVLMLFLHEWVPESPKWLLSCGGGSSTNTSSTRSSNNGEDNGNLMTPRDHVHKLLISMRNQDHDVDAEVNALEEEARKEAQSEAAEVTWAEVFQYRQGMIVGCGLMFFQAVTGINTVIFYSTTIFGLAGFDQAIIGSATVGIVNFLFTLLATYLIDKHGRKILLFSGTSLMLGGLVLLSVILLLPVDDSIQVSAFECASSSSSFAVGCLPPFLQFSRVPDLDPRKP